MPRGIKKAEDEQKEQQPDAEHTEGGFGTGLRAQLQKRRVKADGTPAQEPSQPQLTEPPLVRLDLSTSAPYQVNGAESDVEVEDLQGQLAEAQKRERELRAALAEQVEAYERKLSEEYDVSREQTTLDARSAKLSSTESDLRGREQRLADERRELNNERMRLSQLQDDVAGAQAKASVLNEELKAREGELTEAERLA